MEKRILDNGDLNDKYVDLLDEDKELSNQKHCCISFVSPETIIKQKNEFLFEKFIQQYDSNKSLEKYNNFLKYVSYKYNMEYDDLIKEFKSFIEEEKKNLLNTTMYDDYANFMDLQGEKLEEDFTKLYKFQTNTRGIKIRGSFSTEEEANNRARMLHKVDPNHDIYVGKVGVWMPFNPDAYKTGKVEYAVDELNSIMNYKANKEDIERVDFDERVKTAKKTAIQENIKKAKETNNKLTQNIDEDDNVTQSSGVVSTQLLNDVLKEENISTLSFNNKLN